MAGTSGMLYLALGTSTSDDTSLFQAPTMLRNDGSGQEVGQVVTQHNGANVEVRIQKMVRPNSIRFRFQTRKVNSIGPYTFQESVFTKPPQTLEAQILGKKGGQEYSVYVLTVLNADGEVTSHWPVEDVPFLKDFGKRTT